jgi:hypothetical protein
VAQPVREAKERPVRVAAVAPPRLVPVKVADTKPAEEKPAEAKADGDRLASIESTLVKLPTAPPAPKPIVERGASRRTPAPERTLASRPASDETTSATKRGAKPDPKKPVQLAAKDSKARGKSLEEEPAKPAKSAVTASRVYVQLAGGANADRMSREYDRIRKVRASLFRARQPVVSEVKGWSRLLVGPFKDAGEAQEFVNDLHAAKLEGFVWTAPSGLKLEKLSPK